MDNRSITWLHISDIHFGHGGEKARHRVDQKIICAEILRDAKEMAMHLGSPDLIFITGDVAFKGDPRQEYLQAAKWIEELLQAVNAKKNQLYMVPGNHDVDRGKVKNNPNCRHIHEYLRQKPADLDDHLATPRGMACIWPKFKAYAQFAKPYAAPLLTPKSPFWIRECTPVFGNVIVVGLNTCLLSFDDNDGKPDKDGRPNLMLGNKQLLETIEKQPRDTLLLVLQHHPSELLSDGDRLQAMLQDRPHILFCGHIHKQGGVVSFPLQGQGLLGLVAGAGHIDPDVPPEHAYAWGRLSSVGLEYFPRTWVHNLHQFRPDHNRFTDMQDGAVFRARDRLPEALRNWLFNQELPPPPPELAKIKPIIEQRSYLQKLMMAYYGEKGFTNYIGALIKNKYECPLLTKPQWVPSIPWDISKIILEWDKGAQRVRPLWPGLADKLRNECHVPIRDDMTYRITRIEATNGFLRILCCNDTYNAYIDTCEALTWELGKALYITGRSSFTDLSSLEETLQIIKPKLSNRNNIDPFDISSRSMTPGINTLTVIARRELQETSFLMHHRKSNLAEAMNTLHVVPAGTFQPMCENDVYRSLEFNLRRNILREFGEELLNKETLILQESRLNPEAPFQKDEDLSHLKSIFESDGVDLMFMGLALDCVTLKPEIMTLLIINGDLISKKWENLKINWEAKKLEYVRFDRESLDGWLRKPNLLPAASGCLALALHHFDYIEKAISKYL